MAELPKLLELAAHDNVVVKITGACTLWHEPFPYKDIWDPLGRIFDAFGLDRCMWGTDWTRAVALLTYKQGVEAFRVTDRLSDSRSRRSHGRDAAARLQLVAREGLSPHAPLATLGIGRGARSGRGARKVNATATAPRPMPNEAM